MERVEVRPVTLFGKTTSDSTERPPIIRQETHFFSTPDVTLNVADELKDVEASSDIFQLDAALSQISAVKAKFITNERVLWSQRKTDGVRKFWELFQAADNWEQHANKSEQLQLCTAWQSLIRAMIADICERTDKAVVQLSEMDIVVAISSEEPAPQSDELTILRVQIQALQQLFSQIPRSEQAIFDAQHQLSKVVAEPKWLGRIFQGIKRQKLTDAEHQQEHERKAAARLQLELYKLAIVHRLQLSTIRQLSEDVPVLLGYIDYTRDYFSASSRSIVSRS